MNFRIVVLFESEKIIARFATKKIARDTIRGLKEVDDRFLAGILEKRIENKWVVIWSLK